MTCDNLILYQKRIVVPKTLYNPEPEQKYTKDIRVSNVPTTYPYICLVARSLPEDGQVHERVPHLYVPQPTSKRTDDRIITPNYPWEKVTTDLFELQGRHYFLMVDYYSRYPEVIKLPSTTLTAIITAMKSIFSRQRIPHTVISDNGPQ